MPRLTGQTYKTITNASWCPIFHIRSILVGQPTNVWCAGTKPSSQGQMTMQRPSLASQKTSRYFKVWKPRFSVLTCSHELASLVSRIGFGHNHLYPSVGLYFLKAFKLFHLQYLHQATSPWRLILIKRLSGTKPLTCSRISLGRLPRWNSTFRLGQVFQSWFVCQRDQWYI